MPETVKDEDVKLFDIVVIPLTFNDDKHVVLFNVVNPEILSEDTHETLLLNVVKPVTHSDVFIKHHKDLSALFPDIRYLFLILYY